jgi:CspA family cold shock protein
MPVHLAGRMSGTVKFFNRDKGYGFIIPDAGGNDVFFHVSALKDTGLSGLEQGDLVTFATEPDKRGKGPKAIGIRMLVVDNDDQPAAKPKVKAKAKAA